LLYTVYIFSVYIFSPFTLFRNISYIFYLSPLRGYWKDGMESPMGKRTYIWFTIHTYIQFTKQHITITLIHRTQIYICKFRIIFLVYKTSNSKVSKSFKNSLMLFLRIIYMIKDSNFVSTDRRVFMLNKCCTTSRPKTPY